MKNIDNYCAAQVADRLERNDNEKHLPLRRGNGCSSTSCELRYLELPCDFLVFFLSDRFANGSILSTIVVVDMLVPKLT